MAYLLDAVVFHPREKIMVPRSVVGKASTMAKSSMFGACCALETRQRRFTNSAIFVRLRVQLAPVGRAGLARLADALGEFAAAQQALGAAIASDRVEAATKGSVDRDREELPGACHTPDCLLALEGGRTESGRLLLDATLIPGKAADGARPPCLRPANVDSEDAALGRRQLVCGSTQRSCVVGAAVSSRSCRGRDSAVQPLPDCPQILDVQEVPRSSAAPLHVDQIVD